MAKNYTAVKTKIAQLKKTAIQSLYKHRGNVSLVCQSLNIGRSIFYKWKRDDVEFSEAVDNIIEFHIDEVEDALKKKIDEGDITAIIFYLKTIGKKRGYVEKRENVVQIEKLGADAIEETYE